MACRNAAKAQQACDEIIRETHNTNVLYKIVDLTSFASIRKFAEEIKRTEERLDILVNNAGVYNEKNEKTEDGNLLLMQANYFGPVLLTELLIDMLKKTSGRTVNVSSMAARFVSKEDDLSDLNKFMEGRHMYSRSKLCNILYTIELASRLTGTGVTVYSLHPGAIATDITKDTFPSVVGSLFRFAMGNLGKNVTEGAQTTIYCAVENGLETHNGEHFEDCHVVKRYKTADDPQLVRKIWNDTKKILKLK